MTKVNEGQEKSAKLQNTFRVFMRKSCKSRILQKRCRKRRNPQCVH